MISTEMRKESGDVCRQGKRSLFMAATIYLLYFEITKDIVNVQGARLLSTQYVTHYDPWADFPFYNPKPKLK